jgi:hypothetical protein
MRSMANYSLATGRRSVVHYRRPALLRIGLGVGPAARSNVRSQWRGPSGAEGGGTLRSASLVRGVDEIQSFAKMAFGAIQQVLC